MGIFKYETSSCKFDTEGHVVSVTYTICKLERNVQTMNAGKEFNHVTWTVCDNSLEFFDLVDDVEPMLPKVGTLGVACKWAKAFSDIFMSMECEGDYDPTVCYRNCILLKEVLGHKAGTKVASVSFNIVDITLVFNIDEDTSTPPIPLTLCELAHTSHPSQA